MSMLAVANLNGPLVTLFAFAAFITWLAFLAACIAHAYYHFGGHKTDFKRPQRQPASRAATPPSWGPRSESDLASAAGRRS
jgi:hypothetical protein